MNRANLQELGNLRERISRCNQHCPNSHRLTAFGFARFRQLHGRQPDWRFVAGRCVLYLGNAVFLPDYALRVPSGLAVAVFGFAQCQRRGRHHHDDGFGVYLRRYGFRFRDFGFAVCRHVVSAQLWPLPHAVCRLYGNVVYFELVFRRQYAFRFV